MSKFSFVVPKVFVVALGLLAPMIAHGQMTPRGDNLQGLENRLQQLEYKLKQMRRDFDTGGASAGTAPRPGAGFATGGEQPPANYAARVEIRMGELEQELTRMTGQLEEQGFTLSRLSTRLDKLVEDVDFRLSALERGRAAGQPNASTPAATAVTPTVNPQSGTSRPGTSMPQTLGTISPQDLEGAGVGDGPTVQQAPLPALTPVSTPAVLPTGTPKEQYDFAYKLVRQGDYAQAELGFREFGELHGSDPLAGNARYWLGETYYVRGDFVQAADAFIGVVTSYPDSPKRPHSMLKLGMSLLAMGQKQEGCATLAELLNKYSEGADATRTRAEGERKRAGCT
jgi:tol-pal system protein YbgF